MKICPVCKSAVDDNAEYCDNCGNDEFYDQPYGQPYQEDYNDYQQPPYQNGYNDYQQPQYQNNYNNYQQPPYQNDYNNYQQPVQQPQYQQPASIQKQPVYEETQQPVYEEPQQPVYEEEQQTVYEEEQPAVEENAVTEEQPQVEENVSAEEQPAETPEQQPEEVEEAEEQPPEPEEPKENPYEVSKNFVFEKTEKKAPVEEVPAEKPKDIKGFLNMIMNTKDHTIEFDKEDIAKNQKNAKIASFGVTFWLPFTMKDYSRYARFYGNQGLLTLILMIPCTILYCLIMGFVICNACTASVYNNGAEVFRYLTFGGWIASIIFFAICYAIPIFVIYLSLNNIKQGKAKDIPFIGSLRLIS